MEKYRYKKQIIKHDNFTSIFNGNTGLYVRGDLEGHPGNMRMQ